MNKPPLEILDDEVKKHVSNKRSDFGPFHRVYKNEGFIFGVTCPDSEFNVVILQSEAAVTSLKTWDATLVAKLIAHPEVFLP